MLEKGPNSGIKYPGRHVVRSEVPKCPSCNTQVPQSAVLHRGCIQNENTHLQGGIWFKTCYSNTHPKGLLNGRPTSKGQAQPKWEQSGQATVQGKYTKHQEKKLSWKGVCKHVCQSAFPCIRGMKQVSTVQNTVNSVKSWYPELWDKIQVPNNLWNRIGVFYSLAS